MNDLKKNIKLDQNQLERIFRKRLCRICRFGDSQDKFINACRCLGPFAYVHKRCFENWIEVTKQQKCDICRFDFQVTLHNRNFFDWVQSTTTNGSKYFRPFIELLTRLHNVIFISLIGITLIVCCDSNECHVHHKESHIVSRSLLIIFIPIIRLTFIMYSLVWFASGIAMEFRFWQKKNQRVNVYPFINKISTATQRHGDGLLNSFVRVSGLKHANKYLKSLSLKI